MFPIIYIQETYVYRMENIDENIMSKHYIIYYTCETKTKSVYFSTGPTTRHYYKPNCYQKRKIHR